MCICIMKYTLILHTIRGTTVIFLPLKILPITFFPKWSMSLSVSSQRHLISGGLILISGRTLTSRQNKIFRNTDKASVWLRSQSLAGVSVRVRLESTEVWNYKVKRDKDKGPGLYSIVNSKPVDNIPFESVFTQNF